MLPLLRLFSWLAAIAVLCSLPARADPPARVGRLSLVEGSVSFRVAGQDESSAATSNWPISSGATLTTGRDGRAEVQVGSNAFQLAGESSTEVLALDDERMALHVLWGSLAITIRDKDQADDIEVTAPAGRIRFAAPGQYRVDVAPSRGDTQVSSREGRAYIYRPGGELAVPDGQRAVIYAASGWFLQPLTRDAFDDWVDARIATGNAPLARRYVSPRMTGHEDLDAYGDWDSTPDYGTIWYPRAIPQGWAPYRDGRWAWIAPWGWTWVDQAPWGFAPFHYGRWLFIGGRWAWVPGTYIVQPVYAPALVGWVGNPGWSIGFSSGSAPAIGWFPLAPREVFVPAYRCSPGYVRRININHVSNGAAINQAVAASPARSSFAHRAMAQALTVVPVNTMRSGSVIKPTAVSQVNQRKVLQAPATARAPGAAWLRPASGALRPGQEVRRNQPIPAAALASSDFRQQKVERRPLAIGPQGSRQTGTPGPAPAPSPAVRSAAGFTAPAPRHDDRWHGQALKAAKDEPASGFQAAPSSHPRGALGRPADQARRDAIPAGIANRPPPRGVLPRAEGQAPPPRPRPKPDFARPPLPGLPPHPAAVPIQPRALAAPMPTASPPRPVFAPPHPGQEISRGQAGPTAAPGSRENRHERGRGQNTR